MTQSKDNRNSKRISINGAMVQYKESDKSIFDIFKSSSEKFPILNLSMQGMRFLSHDPLVVNQPLRINIEIPVLGTEPLQADGRVAWIKYSDRYKASIIGVQFTSIPKESMQRLKNLVGLMGNKIQVKQTVRVAFSEKQREQPTMWQISRDYFVKINVLHGLITGDDTWLTLEIEGDAEEVRKVIQNLKEGGARISSVSGKSSAK
jgi:hypothetical protein